MFIAKLITRFSVRTRIVLLAIIPVVGFLLNGIAFTIGESEVANAFDSARRATALADAGQEFKDAVAAMRIGARDFVTRPGQDRIQSFEESHRRAVQSLAAIEQAVTGVERNEIIALRSRLATVKSNFEYLI